MIDVAGRQSAGPVLVRDVVGVWGEGVGGELDMELLRVLAAELGYRPATTDYEHITELRRQKAHYGVLIAQDPEGTKWQKMIGSPQRTD